MSFLKTMIWVLLITAAICGVTQLAADYLMRDIRLQEPRTLEQYRRGKR